MPFLGRSPRFNKDMKLVNKMVFKIPTYLLHLSHSYKKWTIDSFVTESNSNDLQMSIHVHAELYIQLFSRLKNFATHHNHVTEVLRNWSISPCSYSSLSLLLLFGFLSSSCLLLWHFIFRITFNLLIQKTSRPSMVHEKMRSLGTNTRSSTPVPRTVVQRDEWKWKNRVRI